MATEPLQALLFAPSLWHNILSGQQNVTIREGTRNYRPGKPVMLCCHIANMCLMADITSVTQCKFYKLPFDKLEDLGYSVVDADEIFDSLKRFYPNLTRNSNVTMIEWTNLRGSACGK